MEDEIRISSYVLFSLGTQSRSRLT